MAHRDAADHRSGGEFKPGRPAEMRIGDSIVMVSGGDGLRDFATAFLYVYVQGTDATYARAMAANTGERPLGQHLADRHSSARRLG